MPYRAFLTDCSWGDSHVKILFASRYVDPIHSSANRIFNAQARVLQDEQGVDLEILTWPHDDVWTGPVPVQNPTFPPLKLQREGLSYAVIVGPNSWNELAGGNCIADAAWEAAVEYGMRLLNYLKPDVFHLHHRFGFWWLLASAQRLGIPTMYSNYDWGIGCLRTVLVNGTGELCDGVVAPEKCASCIKAGRRSLTGKINESFVGTWVGKKLLTLLDESPLTGEWLRSTGAVSKPVLDRVMTHQNRLNAVFSGLDHCLTPSEFGKGFFHQFGIAERNITVLPWFHDEVATEPKHLPSAQPFTITYIGRVSPEKGVHLIFEALKLLEEAPQVLLRVASANKSTYCIDLKAKFESSAGKHRVEWQDWAPDWSPIAGLLQNTDVAIIPSTCMDNTPLTLIEAMSYRVPVIATDIPTIAGLLKGTDAGYLAEFNSIGSLTSAIKDAISDKERIRARQTQFPKIQTPREYSSILYHIYKNLIDSRDELHK